MVMPKKMPFSVPLNALRAFESAARHLSVKKAADELGVTPSAVSHQLRILEDIVGFDLLRRVGSQLELTQTGLELAPDLTIGFSKIFSSVNTLMGERKFRPLKLSILPTFASHWLSPRLKSYPFSQTGFELEISTDQGTVDLLEGTIDAGVRYGKGDWANIASCLLFEENVSLLGMHAFKDKNEKNLREYISSSTLFLAERKQADYERWNNSLSGGPVKPSAITIVDSVGLGIKAAIDGAGVTLAGIEISQNDIQAKRISPLFDHLIPAKIGYYLVYSPALARDLRIKNLKIWLLNEVNSM